MKTQSDKDKLFSKIPELGHKGVHIGLQLAHFKKLSDSEFTILWYMPGMDIDIDHKTQVYIEMRRRELGLKITHIAGYKDKGEK